MPTRYGRSAYQACGCRQVVRHELPKLACAGSSPVTRSKKVKADLQFRTAPHRWRFIRRPAFLMGASKFCQLAWDIGKNTSSPACISLSQDLPHCPRWGFVALAESCALFSQDLPWCGNPTITKTKISTFLRLRMSLFQDHTRLFLSVTRKLFRGRGARNNGYSRKRLFSLGFRRFT